MYSCVALQSSRRVFSREWSGLVRPGESSLPVGGLGTVYVKTSNVRWVRRRENNVLGSD